MRINVRPDVVASTMSDDLVKRLQAELAAARAALKKYGQHRRTCRLLQEWPAGMEPQLSRCSCGLRQALASPTPDAVREAEHSADCLSHLVHIGTGKQGSCNCALAAAKEPEKEQDDG